MGRCRVVIPDSLKNLDQTVFTAVYKGITECTEDLHRVAQERSPVDSTTLEKSVNSKVSVSGKTITGVVDAVAIRNGFNYAEKLDTGTYKLGDKSLQKSARGIRSKFTKQPLTVGSGFLTGTARACRKGYTDHVNYKIYEAIAKNSFKVTIK